MDVMAHYRNPSQRAVWQMPVSLASTTKMTDTETPPLDTVFGDFVKNEEEYDVEELAEPWHRYRIQDDPKTTDDQYVLYPIRLGEVLNERYLVEHKLGFGGSLTVWMALDLRDKKNVALKVTYDDSWGVGRK